MHGWETTMDTSASVFLLSFPFLSFSFSFFPFSLTIPIFSFLSFLYLLIGGDCDNLVLNAPNQINPAKISFISEVEKPDINTMKAYVQKLNPVMVAHVSLQITFFLPHFFLLFISFFPFHFPFIFVIIILFKLNIRILIVCVYV